MNFVELYNIREMFTTIGNKTMEDYFNQLSSELNIDTDELKSEFKKHYSNITDWSF